LVNSTTAPEAATEVSADPTEDEEPETGATVDIQATVAAEIAEALTAVATDTPLPTPTVAASSTPTPDLTATFVAACEAAVELVNVYTYQNENTQSAPVDSTFPVNWVLANNGDCPVAADVVWAYVEGETFEQEEPG
jgi:hypothetical protein